MKNITPIFLVGFIVLLAAVPTGVLSYLKNQQPQPRGGLKSISVLR